MELNDLLKKKGYDPERVLVLRHRPYEPELNRRFRWIAAERPDLFNAYQQTHGEKLENTMTKASHVVSFIGHKPGRAVFVGLYAIGQTQRITREEYWRIPAYAELRELGMNGFTEADPRSSVLRFDLEREEFYDFWKGRLVVEWPAPERSWWRRAHRNLIPIQAVLEDSALEEQMPAWDKIILSWQDLKTLPTHWRTVLCHWRGIYYIFDTNQRKGYVGAAYGEENLCHRWENYALSGHGGNSLLKKCDPANFHFSILQIVSPDADPRDVVQLEGTWKERLHSRSPLGLNDN